MADYERACAEFSWSRARHWLDGLTVAVLSRRGYAVLDCEASELRVAIDAAQTRPCPRN